jgi:hypothetical protein
VVSTGDLAASYAAAVRSQVAWQAYKVLGSIEILGNPTQLVSSVASGVRALAVESMQLRPHVGVGKLLGHTATGVLRSLGSLSRLSARSVAALSLDSQWLTDLDREAAAANAAAGGWDTLRRTQQQRLRRTNDDEDEEQRGASEDSPASGVRKPVTTVADSEATVVVHRASPDAAPARRPKPMQKPAPQSNDSADVRRSAFNHVARGVVDGVTGVVAQPVRGARREGAVGLAKGVAVGAVGLFARPIAGIFSGVGAAAATLADVTTIDADQDDPALAPAIIQPSAAMHRSRCARSIAPAAYRGGDGATAAESSRHHHHHRRYSSGGGMGRALSSGFMSETTGGGAASGSVSPAAGSVPGTPAMTPPVPLASAIVRAVDDDGRTDRTVEALYYEAQSVANTHDFARLLMKMFGLFEKSPAVRAHAADIAAAARDEALAHWVIEQAAASNEHPAEAVAPPVAGGNANSVARLVKLRAAYLHHKDGVASQLAKFAPLAQVAAVLSWGELLTEVLRQLDDGSHSDMTPRVAADLVVSAVVQTWRSTAVAGSAGSRPFMV